MTMVMVEWVEAISGMSGEIDRETAQTLTDSIITVGLLKAPPFTDPCMPDRS